MVHRGHHRLDRRAVDEREHGDLRAGEALLDDDLRPAGAEAATAHRFTDGVLRLLARRGNSHALAKCKSVGLHDDWDRAFVEVLERGFLVVEDCVGSRRDVVASHEFLGERLRPLELRRVPAWAEAGDALRLERVDGAIDQRAVRSDDDVIDVLVRRVGDEALDVAGADPDAFGQICHAAIAGSRDDAGDLRRLRQLLDDRVLTPAATDNHDLHLKLLSALRRRSPPPPAPSRRAGSATLPRPSHVPAMSRGCRRRAHRRTSEE